MSVPTTGQRVQLVCHPNTPASDAVRGIEVRVYEEPRGTFGFAYSLAADLSRVRIPAQRSPERTDELWKHTCFEAFVATSGEPSYYELNFAPSTEWAAYRFTGYREGMAPLAMDYPRPMRIRSGPHGLELHVAVRRTNASEPEADARSRIALAAVIEEHDGRISYWALRHAPGKPDFHHPDAFALEL